MKVSEQQKHCGGSGGEADCYSCGEPAAGKCPDSKRPCGHHCNCSWTNDRCHWCGKEFGEQPQQEGEEDWPEVELIRDHFEGSVTVLDREQMARDYPDWEQDADYQVRRYIPAPEQGEEELPSVKTLLRLAEIADEVDAGAAEGLRKFAASLAPDTDDPCKCGHARHEHHYFPDPECGPETGKCAHCNCAKFEFEPPNQGEGSGVALLEMLDVWANWIASGEPMEDTNSQLAAEDIRRAARLLQAQPSPRTALERVAEEFDGR